LREMIKRRKDEGFTLIELMIVIAVIGILAIVLVPKVGSIKTQAKSAGVDTNVRAVEGFVQSRINFWANKNTPQYDADAADVGIQEEIVSAFTSNKITNPISNLTTIDAPTTVDEADAAPDGADTDALQVGGGTTAPAATDIPKGGVVVLSDGTGSALSIIITGYDANGNVTTTSTITP